MVLRDGDGDGDDRDVWCRMTPYEKAEHEAALWAARASDPPMGPRQRRGIELLSEKLPASGYEIRQRNALWLAGATAAPLWSRLERGVLTLGEAVRYLRQAERERKQTRGDVPARLAQLLDIEATSLRSERASDRDASVPPPIGREAFLAGVRTLVGAYAAHALAGHDAPSAARLRRTLEADIATAVTAFHATVRHASKSDLDTHVITGVSRRRLVDACRTLSMDPPRVAHAADALRAKKQYRALARLFHPDVPGAPANAAEVFANASAAYKTITDYNLSLESGPSDDAAGRDDNA